jgi:hypothetical protein
VTVRERIEPGDSWTSRAESAAYVLEPLSDRLLKFVCASARSEADRGPGDLALLSRQE